jgi:hypothetical protein
MSATESAAITARILSFLAYDMEAMTDGRAS